MCVKRDWGGGGGDIFRERILSASGFYLEGQPSEY